MDDELNTLVVGVRADTRAFAADVAAMKAAIDGPLGEAAERAGYRIEGALARAVRTGSLGFEDLRRVALGVMNDIARSAIASGIGAIGGGGAGAGGGLLNVAGSLLGAALGLPGRATGGPVTGGRGYLVGERGPELFVPTSAGRVETLGTAGAGQGFAGRGRDIRITVNVQGAGGDPQRMAASGRRVAMAVRRALDGAEG